MKFDTLLKSRNVVFITEPSDLSKAFIHLFRLYPVNDVCEFKGIGYCMLVPLTHKKTVQDDVTNAQAAATNLSRAINLPISTVFGCVKGIAPDTVDETHIYLVEYRGKRQKKWDRWAISEDQVWQIADMLIPDPSASEVEETRAQRDTVMVTGLFFTGMRIAEFLAMKKHWMSLSNGTLKITVPYREGKFKCKTKAGARNIYVTDDAAIDVLLPWYDEHPDGLGIRDTTAWQRCREIGEKAGFEKPLTPHIFRHGHASWLAAKGMSPQYIMATMGHSNAKISLELYTHQLDSTPDEVTKL